MADRAQYRGYLRNKIRDVADNLGKTDFSDSELNEMLDNAPRRLFPALYQRKELTGQTTDSYGGLTISDSTVDARRVVAVWDDKNKYYLDGWRPRGTGALVGFDANLVTLLLEHYAPYVTPGDDVTAVPWPDDYQGLIVLQAAIDGLERMAADRIDYTGYQPSSETGVDENEVLNAVDALQRQLDRAVESKGMGLPSVSL